MDHSTEQPDQVLAALGRICTMISDETPLPETLRAIVDEAQDLTGARWALFLSLLPAQPPVYYGSPEAQALGPLLLAALDQRLNAEDSAPLSLTLQPPFSASNSLQSLAVPIFRRKNFRGSLAVFYDAPLLNGSPHILTLLGSHASIAMEKWRLDEIVSQSYTGTIRALASAIDARDPSTHRHSQAVTQLAVALAEALDLNEDDINTIRYAAILHDIGKIGISEQILSKPGPLTPAERAVVEAHPLVGSSILAGIPHMRELIPLIRHHHERYDGSGYPDGLCGDEIPLGAQIIGIADSFDAITTERPYHRGMSIPEALSILEEAAGTLFAPELISVFSHMIHQWLGEIHPDD